jgi:hypothetical protein
MRLSAYVLFTLVIAALPRNAGAQGTVPHTGVFGDLHYVEAAGDVVGIEIIVSRTKTGYRVIYQEGEGEPGPVDTVAATIKGDSLFFTLPPGGFSQTPRSFRGLMTPTRLHGHLTGDANDLDLPRRARSARSQ